MAVRRFQLLCANLLHRSIAFDAAAHKLAGGRIARCRRGTAAQSHGEARPQNVSQFFALANQHMGWELNDLARRLDDSPPRWNSSKGSCRRRPQAAFPVSARRSSHA